MDDTVTQADREYRKTATIKASQWWKDGDHPAVGIYNDIDGTGKSVPWIDTLEGGHIVTPGDWIATGVRGEHWPIKPEIFAATYEPVDVDDDRAWPECLNPNAPHNRRHRQAHQPDSALADELRALDAKATPGPWWVLEYDAGDKRKWDNCPSIQAPDSEDCAVIHWDGFKQEYWTSANGDQRQIDANAALIVALRNNLPAILTALGGHHEPSGEAE